MSALRARISFSPSPPPVKPFNPAEEGSPLRARRHQRRRDEKALREQAPSSDASTLHSTTPAQVLPRIGSETSSRAPLKEKNAAGLQRARDGASNVSPAPIELLKTDYHASKQAESVAESIKIMPTPKPASSTPSPPTQETATKKGDTRASKANANKTAALRVENEKQQSSPRVLRGPNSTSSPKFLVPEVVIQSQHMLKKKTGMPAAGMKGRKKVAVASAPVEEEEEDAQDGPLKVENTKRGEKSTNKVVAAKKAAASKPTRKQGAGSSAGKKQATSPTLKSGDKIPAEDSTTHSVAIVSEKQQHQQKEDQVNKPDDLPVGKAPSARQSEQSHSPGHPLFFDTANDDPPDIRDAIPPSSPGRFASWHKTAAISSEDDLEYITPTQYSDHRQQEERLGRRGKVSNGRLGVEFSVPSVVSANGKDTREYTLPKGLAEDTSTTVQMPMHSTPLKHKSKEQASTLLPPLDSPKTAERMAREKERLWGLASDNEDDNDLVVVSVNKGSSDEDTEADKVKTDTRKRKSTPEDKEDIAPNKKSKAPAKKPTKVEQSLKKATEIQDPKLTAEKKAAKDDDAMKVKVKKTPAQNTFQGARTDPEEVEDAGDLFGFIKSQRNYKELLTEKAKRKTSGQTQPIKEAEKDSQTQEDGRFSILFDFNKAVPAPQPLNNHRDDSPAIFDFPIVQETTESVAANKAKEDDAVLDAQFSSELSALDSDLEDDIRTKAVKERKRGKGKAALSSGTVEEEIKPLSIEEILALGSGNDEVLQKEAGKAVGAKGGKKPAGKGRKLQLDDGEEKAPKPKKTKVLKLTQDEAAIAPTRARANSKKGDKATASIIEMDEFDVPPGMSSSDVLDSRGSMKGGKSQIKARTDETKKLTGGNKNKSKPQPRPRPRAAMNPMQEEDWDQLPTPASIGAPKRGAKAKASNVLRDQAAQEYETQPIITPASKKNLKRAKLPEDSDDEENEDPKLSRQRKESATYFDSLKEYQLAVEKV